MTKKVININMKSFLSLILCFVMLFLVIAPTVNAAGSTNEEIEQKIEEYKEEIKKYEEKNGITGEVIDLSRVKNGVSGNGYTVQKNGDNYTITLTNLIAKKLILPADAADLEKSTEGDISYQKDSPRRTNITIKLEGDNKITGYGISGYPVKSIKITGDGNLDVKAFSEPKAERVNRPNKAASETAPEAEKWYKDAELTYYTKAGISVETGDKKYADRNQDTYSDGNSLVFAGTGKITIKAPNYHGLINNGDIKFKSGDIKIESDRSAVSGYRIYVGDDEDKTKFSLELKSNQKAFYDKPTFLGNGYIIMTSKTASTNNLQPKSKIDFQNSYSSYRFVKVAFISDTMVPEISKVTVEEKEEYCYLPEVTVKDDVAIDTITVNGEEVTSFKVNTTNLKTFTIPTSNVARKEIVATDAVGKTSNMTIVAHNGHVPGIVETKNIVEPTCSTAGSHTNEYYCSVCGEFISRQTISDKAYGHSFGEWQVEENRKVRYCNTCGHQELGEVIVEEKVVEPKKESTPAPTTPQKEPTTSSTPSTSTTPSSTPNTNTKPAPSTSSSTPKTNSSSAPSAPTTSNSSPKPATPSTSSSSASSSSSRPASSSSSSSSASSARSSSVSSSKVSVKSNTITASNFTKTYSSKKQSFKINAKQTGNGKLTYSSNNKSVTVNSSGNVTIKAKFVGKATITITSSATSKYQKATKKITVTVNPSKIKLSSVKNTSGKKMTVKWNKNTTVTGYQIQYSTSKNFNSGVKTVTVSSKNTKSKVISKLTKNKTYYVRIRSYKTVSGTKYYSGWSASKSLKIKK